MPNDDPHTSSTAESPSRWYLAIGALVALIAVGAALVLTREDPSMAPSPSFAPPQSTVARSETTNPNPESEVVASLREIIQIRERAFRDRDASLFDDVYTSDCSCLQAGREAINALQREKVVWKDRSVSINVQSVDNINDNLWEVVAIFISDSFRIESEDGSLVREAPPERQRYRFLLTRSAGSWRLGNASLVGSQ
jgi:hypothetical protein